MSHTTRTTTTPRRLAVEACSLFTLGLRARYETGAEQRKAWRELQRRALEEQRAATTKGRR